MGSKRRTQKVIQAELKDVERQLASVQNLKTDPRVAAAQKAVDAAQAAWSIIRYKVLKERMPELERLADVAHALQSEWFAIQRKKGLKVSTAVNNWWTAYKYGVDFGGATSFKWISPDERFVLVHVAGATSWAAVGLTSYNPAHGMLIDRQSGVWNTRYVLTYKGRCNKKVIKAAQTAMVEYLKDKKK